MNKVRTSLVALHLAMLFAISLWVYSSIRFNAISIGGARGGIDFWIRAGDIGFSLGIFLWIACVATSIYMFVRGATLIKERLLWLILSVLIAPSFAFFLNVVLSANISAKY